MSPEVLSDLTIKVVMIFVAAAFIFYGFKLKKTNTGTIHASKETLQNRGMILVVCGCLMFAASTYEIYTLVS